MARGAGAKTGAKSGKRISRSIRAGLTFPMGRVHTKLKRTLGKNRRLSWGAAAYTTAVMEYLSAEILEIAGNVARDFKVRRMTPRHILLAILNDQELAQLMKGVTIPSAGVLPFIHHNLLPKSKQVPGALQAAVATTKKAHKPSQRSPAKKKAAPAAAKRTPKGVTVLNEKTLLNTNVKMCVVQGDIVDVDCDALVHPTNNTLSLNGQVGQHLGKVGGAAFAQIVQKAVASGKTIDTTEACITEGSGFGASYVIHCNGPQWGTSTSIPGLPAKTIPQLEKTVQSCLRVADAKKLKSIVFPSIGSGVGGFPKHTAAEVIIRAIEGYFMEAQRTTIKQVFFVLHDKDSVNVYITELAKLD